ncbi:hypothetical protein DFR29_11889 [Tahibacter aquaticus]|jgi:hypothetical protein|uniref:DUF2383 domain-containing protein n=1 Tax=Tahibacter aquaticus TaxID=520092 RepID=A0A4R6YN07_9GAMM|nr:hypothetical protein [Tahibacter aquaticus]TDR38946.1 hypothetical protein DFR29_11889 [Tahibacter aquaticus]
MSAFDDAQLLIRMLREGREYYAFACDEIRDPEIASVFALAVRSRRDLLDDLVATRLLFQTSPAHAVRSLAPNLGYEELRHQFDPRHPQVQAVALHERERRVIGLMHDLFENEAEGDHSPRLRAAIKKHYAHFVEVEDCLGRWTSQQHMVV